MATFTSAGMSVRSLPQIVPATPGPSRGSGRRRRNDPSNRRQTRASRPSPAGDADHLADPLQAVLEPLQRRAGNEHEVLGLHAAQVLEHGGERPRIALRVFQLHEGRRRRRWTRRRTRTAAAGTGASAARRSTAHEHAARRRQRIFYHVIDVTAVTPASSRGARTVRAPAGARARRGSEPRSLRRCGAPGRGRRARRRRRRRDWTRRRGRTARSRARRPARRPREAPRGPSDPAGARSGRRPA